MRKVGTWLFVGALFVALSALAIKMVATGMSASETASHVPPVTPVVSSKVEDNVALPVAGHTKPSQPPKISTAPERTLQIDGVVLAGAEPVPNASLSAHVGPVTSGTVTGPDGHFSLTIPSRGPLAFDVRGFEVVPGPRGQVEDDLHDVVVQVKGGCSVSGRVLFRGNPAPGADVTVLAGPHSTSDANGTYRFPVLPAGRIVLAARSESLGAESSGIKLTLEAGEAQTGADLDLDRSGRISGVVLDEHGTLVPGVSVLWVCEGCASSGHSVTSPVGSYQVSRLTSGTYRVTVTSAVGAVYASEKPFPVVSLTRTVQDANDVRITIVAATGSIRGRVVDEDGRAIAGADVIVPTPPDRMLGVSMATIARVRTDSEGGFLVDGIPLGIYVLAVDEKGERAEERGVETGRNDVRITVRSRVTVKGSLVGFGDEPVRVGIVNDVGGRPGFDAHTISAPTFAIDSVQSGDRWLLAISGSRVALERIRVAPPSEPKVVLRARPVGHVSGTVVDASAASGNIRCAEYLEIAGLGNVALAPVSPDSNRDFGFDAPTGLALFVECSWDDGMGSVQRGYLSLSGLGPEGATGLQIALEKR